MRLYHYILLVLVVSPLGCATITKGRTQTVSISSVPEGAYVIVRATKDKAEVPNDPMILRTPTHLELKRKFEYTVTLSLEGYQPAEIKLNRKANKFKAGANYILPSLLSLGALQGAPNNGAIVRLYSFVIGVGTIGVAVDAFTGALYKLEPEQLGATLAPNSTLMNMKDGGLHILTVLKPHPGWVKIGQLFPEPSVQIMRQLIQAPETPFLPSQP